MSRRVDPRSRLDSDALFARAEKTALETDAAVQLGITRDGGFRFFGRARCGGRAERAADAQTPRSVTKAIVSAAPNGGREEENDPAAMLASVGGRIPHGGRAA